MSRTKELFEEMFPEMVNTPTESDIEEQYYWELARRQEIYLNFLQEYVENLPESFYFTEDFQKYIDIASLPPEVFIAKRNMAKAITDMEFDLPPLQEDENHQKRNSNFDNLFN